MSQVTFYLIFVLIFDFFYDFFQSGEASWWVCYQQGLPRSFTMRNVQAREGAHRF